MSERDQGSVGISAALKPSPSDGQGAVATASVAPKRGRKPKTIKGYRRELEGGRAVFLGRLGKDWVVSFENPKSDPPKTTFRLSADAMHALIALHRRHTPDPAIQGRDVMRLICQLTRAQLPWWKRILGVPQPKSHWQARWSTPTEDGSQPTAASDGEAQQRAKPGGRPTPFPPQPEGKDR